jgi:hypothetical protein
MVEWESHHTLNWVLIERFKKNNAYIEIHFDEIALCKKNNYNLKNKSDISLNSWKLKIYK